MAMKRSVIISVLMLVLTSFKLIIAIYYESESATRFEELIIKHQWTIHNFRAIALQDQSKYIFSPEFWPPGNESFKWYLQLLPQYTKDSSYIAIYLAHNNTNKVRVNYTLSVGTTKYTTITIFAGKTSWGEHKFMKHDEALQSCLPDGSLVINCEVRAISKVEVSSGKSLVRKNQTCKSKLADDLLTLINDEKYSDITIAVGKYKIRAHKSILAARSPAFAGLLSHNDTPNKTENSSVMEIRYIKPRIFKKLLKFIYTGKLDGNDSASVKELLVAAIDYRVKDLEERCEEILCNDININNAIELLTLAYRHDILKLKSLASSFIVENAAVIIHSTAFKNLERSQPNPMYEVLHALLHA